jgi:carbon starvation protein
MDAIVLLLLSFAVFAAAYYGYGRFLARRVFRLDDNRPVPSQTLRDDKDFVPSRKGIVFGHHYASIAGTGPIVGPAIGVIWGWLPALLWILIGSVFMGAVHDFGALVVSLRNQGRSMGDIIASLVGPRVKTMFFLIVFLELLIVIAVFGLVIASIFDMFPTSVLPVWGQIPLALILGAIISSKKAGAGAGVSKWTAVMVAAMYLLVFAGQYFPFTMPAMAGIPATGVWAIILLTYAFIASILPVTALLQPRDYMNAWQLFVAMGLILAGALAAGFTSQMSLVAPALNPSPAGAPPMFPVLFIIIACGAISGFHALVSSGTSSKQLSRESDALFVGYGSMLLEAALATLVLVAVAAGLGMSYTADDGSLLTGVAAWKTHYASWSASQGMASNMKAVVVGCANMMSTIGIPITVGTVIMGVFIASFAGTTLDSAARIQRYVISEMASGVRGLNLLGNRYAATALAVFSAAFLAFATGADGKGALRLWPMFGAVNQLLAALALVVITLYLRREHRRAWLVSALPCLFMLVMTVWGVIVNEFDFINARNWLLAFINGGVLLLSLSMVAESSRVFLQRKEVSVA